MVTCSLMVKALFSDTFFPCFSIPMGSWYNSWPSETLWLQLPSYWRDFQMKSPCRVHRTALQSCMCACKGLQCWIYFPHMDTLLSPLSLSLQSSLILPPPLLFLPKSYSHDRNKLARGTGHTLDSSKCSVRNQQRKWDSQTAEAEGMMHWWLYTNHTKEPENSLQGRGWCTLGLLIPTPESKILLQKRCSPDTCASGSFFLRKPKCCYARTH